MAICFDLPQSKCYNIRKEMTRAWYRQNGVSGAVLAARALVTVLRALVTVLRAVHWLLLMKGSHIRGQPDQSGHIRACMYRMIRALHIKSLSSPMFRNCLPFLNCKQTLQIDFSRSIGSWHCHSKDVSSSSRDLLELVIPTSSTSTVMILNQLESVRHYSSLHAVRAISRSKACKIVSKWDRICTDE